MNFLLDTHALLWALGDPARLGERARAVLRDPQQSLLVSAASAWEIATKQRLGKLPGTEGVTAGYAHSLRRLGARSAPVADEHALLAGSLGWAHRDPFDRMLAAQALTESWTLVTRDPVFGGLAGISILW